MYTAYLQSVTAVPLSTNNRARKCGHFSITRNLDSYLKVYIMINIVQLTRVQNKW